MLKHEKEVLEMIKFSFCVELRATCKDANNFYFLMKYINGVEFSNVLYELGKFQIKKPTIPLEVLF